MRIRVVGEILNPERKSCGFKKYPDLRQHALEYCWQIFRTVESLSGGDFFKVTIYILRMVWKTEMCFLNKISFPVKSNGI